MNYLNAQLGWRALQLSMLSAALASALLLWACASSAPELGAAAQHADLLTDSDEPAQRKRARIHLELALGYFEQGKTTIALDALKQAILADAGFPEAYSLRGLIYMRLNDYEIAQSSFQKALLLSPANPDILHNLAWLKCQQGQYPQALTYFAQALANPRYLARSKTLMTQGLCQQRAGDSVQAEQSLRKSYEIDAANPVTGYNLALLLYQKGDLVAAQFYIQRLNSSVMANAESLWLGIRIEKKLAAPQQVAQLALQLEKRFSQSREAQAYRRGAFDE